MSNTPYYNIQSVKLSFDEPVTKVKAVTLPDLWAKKTAFKRDKEGMFYYLEIHAEERPITLMEGSGWMAFVEKGAGKDQWEIGLWAQQLLNYAGAPHRHELKEIAQEICTVAQGLEPASWLRFKSSSKGEPESPQLPPLG